MTSRRTITFSILFLVGLALRIYMISYPGGYDMLSYFAWGRDVRNIGLAHGYQGTYFPVQYQLFALCSGIAAGCHLPEYAVFKASNLVFDLGIVLLLRALIKQLGGNPAYAFLYWLHPWFLAIFSQGYIDSHFTFFVLLMLVVLKNGETVRRQLLAGIPLGASVLMKPQAAVLLFAFPFYIALMAWKHRSFRALPLLAGPSLLLIGYNIYFSVSLYPQLGFRAAVEMLRYYPDVAAIMPVLSAYMLNMWYPLAFALKSPEGDTAMVSSKIHILPFVEAQTIAAVISITLIAWFIWRLVHAGLRPRNRTYLLIACFATTVVPVIMTSAHENHLFLASVLFIPLLAISREPLFNVSVQLTLLLQGLNLYLSYGAGQLAARLRPFYPENVRALLAVFSVVLFVIIARHLFLLATRPSTGLRTGSTAGLSSFTTTISLPRAARRFPRIWRIATLPTKCGPMVRPG